MSSFEGQVRDSVFGNNTVGFGPYCREVTGEAGVVDLDRNTVNTHKQLTQHRLLHYTRDHSLHSGVKMHDYI